MIGIRCLRCTTSGEHASASTVHVWEAVCIHAHVRPLCSLNSSCLLLLTSRGMHVCVSACGHCMCDLTAPAAMMTLFFLSLSAGLYELLVSLPSQLQPHVSRPEDSAFLQDMFGERGLHSLVKVEQFLVLFIS